MCTVTLSSLQQRQQVRIPTPTQPHCYRHNIKTTLQAQGSRPMTSETTLQGVCGRTVPTFFVYLYHRKPWELTSEYSHVQNMEQ